MVISDDWLVHHFDYLSPDFGRDIHAPLARLRKLCPVAHSDQHGGYWVLTRHKDVLRAAQDWQTWSSEVGGGVGIPAVRMTIKALPEHVDPPLQREYKRLINPWFTPAVVERYAAPTQRIASRLIDSFIEAGSCEFQSAFARPFPGLAFFELVLNAPADEAAEVNAHATAATTPGNPDSKKHWAALTDWIVTFLDERRRAPRKHDVVDAVLHARIEGRPIRDDEVLGIVTLLILGGLDTTAGVLGATMIRFCRQPEIPELLRSHPELLPSAVEELVRLEGSFIGIGRTARHDTTLDGIVVPAGSKAYLSWAAANRDESEFCEPDRFDPHRQPNRHLAFGAGPHRCAGSHLARLNLRIAIGEIVKRLHDIRLAVDPEEIDWHIGFNRAPLTVPITFTPGARVSP